jgi:hypothetical protein
MNLLVRAFYTNRPEKMKHKKLEMVLLYRLLKKYAS